MRCVQQQETHNTLNNRYMKQLPEICFAVLERWLSFHKHSINLVETGTRPHEDSMIWESARIWLGYDNEACAESSSLAKLVLPLTPWAYKWQKSFSSKESWENNAIWNWFTTTNESIELQSNEHLALRAALIRCANTFDPWGLEGSKFYKDESPHTLQRCQEKVLRNASTPCHQNGNENDPRSICR